MVYVIDMHCKSDDCPTVLFPLRVAMGPLTVEAVEWYFHTHPPVCPLCRGPVGVGDVEGPVVPMPDDALPHSGD